MPRRSPKRSVHAVKAAWSEITRKRWVAKTAWPTITRKQWVAIGKAYMRPIRVPVRQAIDNSLREYAALERAEAGGVPITAADRVLADIRDHARALLAALTAEGDAALLAHDLIEQAGIELDPLRGRLAVLDHEYPLLDLRPHKAGEAWDAWARNVTAICNDHRLPTEARQDDDAQHKPSPFVALVEKLQAFLPLQLQRHTQSRIALATAINRARARSG